MPAGTDGIDLVQGKRCRVYPGGAIDSKETFDQLNIENKFLERGDQSAIEPAGRLQYDVGMGHDGWPQVEERFVCCLGIWEL